MKKFIIKFAFNFFLTLVIIPGCMTHAFCQGVSLPNKVRFQFGDQPEWADPDFSDDGWSEQILPISFTKDSTFGWYRIKIVVPQSMQKYCENGLKLFLGKIDDVDQTFLNGKLIGQTGSFPPDYVTQWQQPRVYRISENDILWGQENVIAVRIYNLIGGMGMWEGPYRIEPYGWVDEIEVNSSVSGTQQKGFVTKLRITNKVDKTFRGNIRYWVADKENNEVLFSEMKSVYLEAKKDLVNEVIFSEFKSNERVFNVIYQVNDENSPLFLKKEQLFILTDQLQIPVISKVAPLINGSIQPKFRSNIGQNSVYTGYLGKRFTQNLSERLLKVDEFGLIGSYLDRPGIHPWAGEHVGKYLEAGCNVWQLTQDKELKKQMDRIMFVLINCQKEDGYLGTYTPDQYWTSWDVWSHKYNLHGLLAYYSATGYEPALNACIKIGDLLCKTFGKNEGQLDIISAGTHMGMAATSILDAMVELYNYTADKKYLDFCYYIVESWEQENGPKVISAMLETGKVKKVGNGKAYEMLSNYVGLAKLYQVTGDPKYLKVCEMAWKDIVENQLYITGTTSSHEYFQDDDYLPASKFNNVGEGCVTTTWVQLNQNLFEITGELKYLNELEKSVYNQLLGAENPHTGCVSYFTPLMDRKPYTCHITCCQSSVPRGIALVPKFTVGHLNQIPTLLFYEPAVYQDFIVDAKGKQTDLSIEVKGRFPESGDVSILVKTSSKARFTISLRVPGWCTNFVAVAGKKKYIGIAGEYVLIDKTWKSGETIDIHFDMPLIVLSGKESYPGKIAFQRGPQILAVDADLNSSRVFELISMPENQFPIGLKNLVVESDILPENWFGEQVYSLNLTGQNEKIILVPFAEASQLGGEIKVWLPLSAESE